MIRSPFFNSVSRVRQLEALKRNHAFTFFVGVLAAYNYGNMISEQNMVTIALYFIVTFLFALYARWRNISLMLCASIISAIATSIIRNINWIVRLDLPSAFLIKSILSFILLIIVSVAIFFAIKETESQTKEVQDGF